VIDKISLWTGNSRSMCPSSRRNHRVPADVHLAEVGSAEDFLGEPDPLVTPSVREGVDAHGEHEVSAVVGQDEAIYRVELVLAQQAGRTVRSVAGTDIAQ